MINTLLVPGSCLTAGVLTLIALYLLERPTFNPVRTGIGLLWVTLALAATGYFVPRLPSLTLGVSLTVLIAVLLGCAYSFLAPMLLTTGSKHRTPTVILSAVCFYAWGVTGLSATYVTARYPTEQLLYWMGGAAAFLLPPFLVHSYTLWMNIPPLKYKSWLYPVQQAVPRLHPVAPIKLRMNFTPEPADEHVELEGYEVEFPTNVPLSELFHYFISFHNKHREYRKKPIQYLINDQPLSWLFYTRNTRNQKTYLDCDKTLPENGIHPGGEIFAISFKAY